ncbi:uncharacterized protein PFL1_02869 [Pseudozyma flocculosa PF-1]|uniref:Mitochondrial carrier protein n=2 Tax=Pseudozyma flocculosa TaxID=84751 RepID=A0A5C3F3G2_9BASI|nr:uncharacterized protein PFL1_02869 [Pseudozyma flocculosa PF-1]EPQ29649.1 hypothetical protein PFL1_02869 [Pseudozyma flocculosa PF-1]SPO38217.1 uncharacterized protein PSFLO_03694 [Pseudozyma flocculosa]
MSVIAAVGLQVATSALVTYPYEVTEVTYKANYQPLPNSPAALSAPGSVRLTSLYSTLKHHLLSSPQGAFELLRGAVPSFLYSVAYVSLFPAYASLFNAVLPTPTLGAPTGVVWRDALPFEAHRALATSTWRVVLQPLTSLLYRTLLAPGCRELAPIFPSVSALWNASTRTTSAHHVDTSSSSSSRAATEAKQRVNEASDRVAQSGVASLFLPSVSLLEFGHGILSAAANLVVAQAGLPILSYAAPQHFPPSPRGFGFDVLNAALWALGGVALRLSAMAFRTVSIRLSVQDTATPAASDVEASSASAGTGDKGASKIVLRPKRYTGIPDAFASIVREEGLGALFRGWVVALMLDVVAVSSTMAMAAASLPQMTEGPSF